VTQDAQEEGKRHYITICLPFTTIHLPILLSLVAQLNHTTTGLNLHYYSIFNRGGRSNRFGRKVTFNHVLNQGGFSKATASVNTLTEAVKL
jgi:hypothetical protein